MQFLNWVGVHPVLGVLFVLIAANVAGYAIKGVMFAIGVVSGRKFNIQ
jgi:hypothetical protein